MKITCPNCQKKYCLNEAKLPQGIKNAKCKACGHLMPLHKAPAEASPPAIDPLKVVCRNCGQRYRFQPDKIPPTLKTITCKSCARPVPLSRAGITAPVHPLKKNLFVPAAAKPVEPTATKIAIVGFRCTGCGKIYKIDRHKVPPNVQSVKCRACGHKIQLPQEKTIKTADGPIRPDAQHGKPSFRHKNTLA